MPCPRISVQLFGMKTLTSQPVPYLPGLETSRRKPRGRRSAAPSPVVVVGPGRARAAADTPAPSRVEYRPLFSRTLLNENSNRALPFFWTINPYRGCEFGCSYCYARFTHDFLEHASSDDFDRRIYAKVDALDALERQLRPELFRGRPVALGTATDPYQPAEHTFRLTRRILERLVDCPDLALSITTKSPLILRDLDLLVRLSRRARLRVQISLSTLLPDLARVVGGRSPGPRRRLETIERLADAGIETVLFAMPLLPQINDGERDLERLLRAARAVGAVGAEASVLHLESAARKSFFPILRRAFPELAFAYEERYRDSHQAPLAERQAIHARFGAIRARLQMVPPPWPTETRVIEPSPQLSFEV